MEGVNYVLRPAFQTDFNYVRAMWDRAFKALDKEYRPAMPAITNAYIVCTPEIPDYILAFAVVDGSTLLCLFTRQEWRKLGVATFIMNNMKLFYYLYRTPDFLKFMQNRFDKNLTVLKHRSPERSYS